MINIQYQPLLKETTLATLQFLESRPVLKSLILFMKLSVFLLLVGFILKSLGGHATSEDLAVVLTGFIWLGGRKALHRFTLNRSFKKNQYGLTKHHYQVNHHHITWQDQQKNQKSLNLKKIPFILQNKLGYMIPITGAFQGAKFLWFPKRGFQEQEDEKKFLTFIEKSQIKLKKI